MEQEETKTPFLLYHVLVLGKYQGSQTNLLINSDVAKRQKCLKCDISDIRLTLTLPSPLKLPS